MKTKKRKYSKRKHITKNHKKSKGKKNDVTRARGPIFDFLFGTREQRHPRLHTQISHRGITTVKPGIIYNISAHSCVYGKKMDVPPSLEQVDNIAYSFSYKNLS